MQLSIRAVFAGLLWAAALAPVALWAIHLGSPAAAVEVADVAGEVARLALLGGGAVVLVGLLVYPPFLPALRLGFQRLRRRLGTDYGPLNEALGRLRHLETAADHLAAGRILLQQGQLRPALEHLGRAAELDPQHAGTRYQLGLALARLGNLRGAAEQLAQVVRSEPAHAFGAAMLELGVVLERGGADAQAVEVLERHEREFGPNRRNRFHRARAHAHLGRRDAAVADLRQAAAPPQQGRKLSTEEQLIRARAKVALLRGGRL